MKKAIKIALSLLIVGALFTGITVIADVVDPEPASAHTYEAAKAACDWIEVRVWGPNPNGITRLKNAPVHYWGSHQADCRYGDIGLYDRRECVLVDLVTGVEAWLGDCYV